MATFRWLTAKAPNEPLNKLPKSLKRRMKKQWKPY